jgi:hypothetical protein
MLWTSQLPSSGGRELYLTEVTDIGSVLPVVSCMVNVWLHILTLGVCVSTTLVRDAPEKEGEEDGGRSG